MNVPSGDPDTDVKDRLKAIEMAVLANINKQSQTSHPTQSEAIGQTVQKGSVSQMQAHPISAEAEAPTQQSNAEQFNKPNLPQDRPQGL